MRRHFTEDEHAKELLAKAAGLVTGLRATVQVDLLRWTLEFDGHKSINMIIIQHDWPEAGRVYVLQTLILGLSYILGAMGRIPHEGP